MTPPPSGTATRPDEFELIERIFAPLARGAPFAFGLKDDVAAFPATPGDDIVLKTDSVIEGVHFLRSDPPVNVGQKALRRPLSDIAAKGAEPFVYLLALALPLWADMNWLHAFAGGLATDQRAFHISLAGGETNATPGPIVISVTVVGITQHGRLLRRSGAAPGDGVFVTGTIGDAGAGLQLARNAPAAGDSVHDFLISRFRLPVPRLPFGRALRDLASAALDVSDGLLQDVDHLAQASGVRIEIDAAKVPQSSQLREFWGPRDEALLRAATAGDDYEIAFTAPLSNLDLLVAAAERTSTPVTQIGRVVAGEGTAFLNKAGKELSAERRGYTHFR